MNQFKFNVEGVIEEVGDEGYRVRYGEHSVTPFLPQAPLGVGQFHIKSAMMKGDKVLITHVEHGVLLPIATGDAVLEYNRKKESLLFKKKSSFLGDVTIEGSLNVSGDVTIDGCLMVAGMDIKQTLETHTHGAGSLIGQAKVTGVTGTMT